MMLMRLVCLSAILCSSTQADGKFHAYPLSGKPDAGYYVTMLFGTPPQKLNVLIDTGE